jgi:hypothetical protein
LDIPPPPRRSRSKSPGRRGRRQYQNYPWKAQWLIHAYFAIDIADIVNITNFQIISYLLLFWFLLSFFK